MLQAARTASAGSRSSYSLGRLLTGLVRGSRYLDFDVMDVVLCSVFFDHGYMDFPPCDVVFDSGARECFHGLCEQSVML